jgi:hypothetical protein
VDPKIYTGDADEEREKGAHCEYIQFHASALLDAGKYTPSVR